MGLSALTVMVKGLPACPVFTARPHWRDLRVGHGYWLPWALSRTWATEGPSWVEPLELVPWAQDAVGGSEQRPRGETCCQDDGLQGLPDPLAETRHYPGPSPPDPRSVASSPPEGGRGPHIWDGAAWSAQWLHFTDKKTEVQRDYWAALKSHSK